MKNINTDNQQLLEEAKREFLVELERCESEASMPSLTEFIRQYPPIAAELLAWVTTLVVRHQAIKQETALPEASERTMAIINSVKAAVRAEPKNLNEAREALGLSQIKFAKRLRLAPTVTKGLGRGAQHWPKVLEDMLSTVLVRSHEQVVSLLQASTAVPAGNFKGTGDPTSQPFQTKSFRDLLEDADRKGELLPEDKQFWIEQLEAEGK